MRQGHDGDGAAKRILLVEDDEIVRDALSIALSRHGFAVTAPEVVAKPALIEILHSVRPDIVLLDYFLHGDEALDMIEPLTALGATVIMLTATSDQTILGNCLTRGAAGAIIKRQPMRDLLHAIELAASGHAVQRPAERDELISAARTAHRERQALLASFDSLSAREARVLAGLVDGCNAEEIADRDFVSLTTVRTQIRGVLTKLGVSSQLAAVALARRAAWPTTANDHQF